MDLGIIGKARSGKTSVFNAVTRGTAQVGVYSAGNEPNVGVVKVPDERVDALVGVFTPKKTTYAEIRWVDYPIDGFGAEGPGRQFVTELAKADALVHVVRAFEDDSVPHPEGSVDAHRDIDALNLELTFVDLGLIERRLQRIDQEMKSMKAAERQGMEAHRELLGRLQSHLEGGEGLRSLTLSEAEEKELRAYQFITMLPVLLIVNIGEDDGLDGTHQMHARIDFVASVFIGRQQQLDPDPQQQESANDLQVWELEQLQGKEDQNYAKRNRAEHAPENGLRTLLGGQPARSQRDYHRIVTAEQDIDGDDLADGDPEIR